MKTLTEVEVKECTIQTKHKCEISVVSNTDAKAEDKLDGESKENRNVVRSP